MSDSPSFPYELLWNEGTIRSVANLTRADGEAFFRHIAPMRIETKRTSIRRKTPTRRSPICGAGN